MYGRSNTGKTTLAGSFPKPLLLLDVNDRGADDVLLGMDGIDVRSIESWADLESTYWWLHRNPKKYKTVVVDTVSQLQKLAIDQAMSNRDRHSSMKGKELGTFGSMSRKDWGAVSALMKSWLTSLRDLPMEIVFIAQDRAFRDEDEGDDTGIDPTVGPALSPSVSTHLNAIVHIIGNTFIRRRRVKTKVKVGKVIKTVEKDKIEYCIRLGPNPVYVTKVRNPKHVVTPSVLPDPTYQKIQAIITGEEAP